MPYLEMSDHVDCHIDPETLEQYAMGLTSEEQTARCEEHLLLCESCRQALEDADSRVAAMRAAAAHERQMPAQRSWWSFPRLAPAAAAFALLILAFVLFRWTGSTQPPLAITLTATRGAGIEALAPAGRSLALTPDLTALPPDTSYGLQIVDDQGRQTWQGRYNPAQGPASVSAQRAGTHFVRIYSGTGELLREYGLDVKR